jgi:hypothetical protein
MQMCSTAQNEQAAAAAADKKKETDDSRIRSVKRRRWFEYACYYMVE